MRRRALLLGAIVLVAFAVRTIPELPAVFTPSGISLTTNDALYHLRYAENLVAHLPLPMTWDPYLHAGGDVVPVAPFLGYAIALLSWLLGGAHPTSLLLETVAVWLPPILGALTIAAVFLLALELAGDTAAFTAAALLAVMPSEFFYRSMLGYVDHHVAEVLFSTAALALLVRAYRTGAWRDAVLAGVSLGLYCLAWRSAVMGIAVLLTALFLLLVMTADARVFRLLAAAFASAIPFALAVPGTRTAALFLAAGALVAIIGARNRRLAIAIAVVVPLLAFALRVPFVMHLLRQASVLRPAAMGRTVTEAQTLLLPEGAEILWRQLRLAGPVALTGLFLLLLAMRKERRAEAITFAAWAVAFLAATLLERRFLYYLAAIVAVLAGVCVARFRHRPGVATVVVIAVVAAAITPILWRPAAQAAVTPAWEEAARWMRHDTPEPFAPRDLYLARVTRRGDVAAYTVATWWDTGYTVIREGHRVPTANPTQRGARETAALLLAQDADQAATRARALGARYIAVDSSLPLLRPSSTMTRAGALLAQVAVWNREPSERYFEQYLFAPEGQPSRLIYLFYPEYFRSLAIRLYLFGGRAALPDYWVVTFDPLSQPKRILAMERFPSYRDAMDSVVTASASNRRLVSLDPMQSCVPIEPLEHFTEVFSSTARDLDAAGRPQVRVFQIR